MPRKKRTGNRRQAVGATLMVAGLLLGLSFLPKATGLPVLLGRGQRLLLGEAAGVIPLAMLTAGLALAVVRDPSRLTRRFIGATLLILAGLAAYHARLPRGEEIAAGLAGEGSGVVGGGFLWALRRAFGDTGAWMIMALAALAGALAWSGIAFATAVDAAWMTLVKFGRLVIHAGAMLWRTMVAAAATGVRTVTSALLTGAAATRRILQAVPSTSIASPSSVGSPIPRESVPKPEVGSAPVAVEVVTSSVGDRRVVGKDGEVSAERSRAGSSRTPVVKQERLAIDVPSGGYQLPPLTLLTDLPNNRMKGKTDPADVAKALEQTLASFAVEAKVTRWEQGPVVTRFEVQPAPGVRVQKISSLTNDIALALAAPSVRIEAPIPGKSAVGIELPNQKTSLVHIKEILASEEYRRTTGALLVTLGKDIAGHPILADLAEMPHLLIAGATGSGKSVMLNAIIAGLLFRCTPLDVRVLMIDPKRVEFAHYNNIPHLLVPVVTHPRAIAAALREMLREMEDRFERFAQTGTRNIQMYNQLPDVERLPYVVIIIDELADLMMVAPADFEDVICRLAQMTRATGIHMVLATQRPSVDVITGLIKANIPSRIAFAVTSQVDSRTILDMPGAEKLLGRGDMLFLPISATRPVRAQGAFIADSEIQSLVAWWKAQGRPVYDQDLLHAEKSGEAAEGDADELLAEAARLIVRSGYGSVSLLQRKMKIGYVRAARIVDHLEEKGIVGPAQGSNPREVLVGVDELEQLLKGK